MTPRVAVFPGRNVWRLLRGNVDEPDPEDIPQKAAALVRYVFEDSQAPTHELVSVGPDEWRFGDVRPLRVLSVSDAPQKLPPGTLLGDRTLLLDVNVAPAVRVKPATVPSFVLVEFWWRGSPTKTVAWPAWQKGILGPTYALTGADWLLDAAVFDPDAADPGDETWGEAQGERASEVTGNLGKLAEMFGGAIGTTIVVQGAALAAGVWLYLKLKSRPKTK